ncbi:hypothetical protein J5N97_015660 [Dioscorea zingiberensis]|uniref:F-box domain-containing protein n=1 Tax=Dioscorea zingiberensis TaxID=325984 RepID=A0A9D5HET2_9LILI|nr:hypothetical protein J5N97_015660 [Dioscorea zingiberensis]
MKDSKKSPPCQEDRLSALPSELLHQILTFLPDTKSRARTCVLSRRWIGLWASHPSIDLRLRYRIDLLAAARAHVAAVDAALDAASAATLRRLDVDVWLPSGPDNHPANAATVDRWFRAAADLGVRDLSIQTKSFPSSSISELPCSLFGCRELTSLRIKNGVIPEVPSSFDGFHALTTLFFEHVLLSTEIFAAVIAGSPLLEALHIQGFSGVARLDVSPENLPNLSSFSMFEPYGEQVKARIVAPNLTSIHFDGDLNLLSWNGSPCLVEATLRNEPYLDFQSESCWMELVSAVSNAKTLTVNNLFYQFVIPNKYVNGSHEAMFKNLRKLTCEIDWVTGPLLCSFISNIRECPLLENLCISFNRVLRLKAKKIMKRSLFFCNKPFHPAELVKAVEEKFEKDEFDLSEHRWGMGNALDCLKILEIEHFMGTKNETLLIEFLLKNAVNLRKFLVDDFFMRTNEEIHRLFYPIKFDYDNGKEELEQEEDEYDMLGVKLLDPNRKDVFWPIGFLAADISSHALWTPAILYLF